MGIDFETLNAFGCGWSIEGSTAYFKGKPVAYRSYSKFESWYDKPAVYFLTVPPHPELAAFVLAARKAATP